MENEKRVKINEDSTYRDSEESKAGKISFLWKLKKIKKRRKK